MEFQIFRIKVQDRPIKGLFEEDRPSNGDVLRICLMSMPTDLEFSSTLRWKVSTPINISVNPEVYYFKFGRVKKFPNAEYEDNDFKDSEVDLGTYTHVFIDIPLGLAAIAINSNVARNSETIAKRLETLLNRTEKANSYGIRILVAPLSDPVELLTYIEDDYKFRQFWFEYHQPNPRDQDNAVEALENVVKGLDGDRGVTKVRGRELNNREMKEITQSVLATGGDAGGSVVLGNGKTRPVSTRNGAPVTFSQEVEGGHITSAERLSVIDILYSTYTQIRGRNGRK